MVIVSLEMELQIKVTNFLLTRKQFFMSRQPLTYSITKFLFYAGLTPTLVQGALTGKTVVDVACGSHHSICLTSDGELYAWGKKS